MNTILIVEDERMISDLIRINLTDAGYRCECVYDGIQAADRLEAHPYDLILLDIMLPGISGYDLMEYVRPLEIPVIFITAKSEISDRVKGLKLGADDYLTKPFAIAELLARVETVLRRYHKSDRFYRIGDVLVDTLSHTVTKAGTPVALTVKEYDLLLLLVQNRNVALFRDRIYEKVWGECDTGGTRTIDLHVQRLRRKLGWENRITAIYKVGYRLEDHS